MNMKLNSLNCPNCGAPITSKTCPYCGTTFTNYIDEDKELRELQYLLRKKEIDLAQMRQTEFIMQDVNSVQLFNYKCMPFDITADEILTKKIAYTNGSQLIGTII